MEKTARLLLELQELDIILSEAKIVHNDPGKDSEEIQKKIRGIRQKIGQDMLSRYDRLKRQGSAVVQENSGQCMGCYLPIPVGDLQRMKNRKIESICPNCGKFLIMSSIIEDILSESRQEMTAQRLDKRKENN